MLDRNFIFFDDDFVRIHVIVTLKRLQCDVGNEDVRQKQNFCSYYIESQIAVGKTL